MNIRLLHMLRSADVVAGHGDSAAQLRLRSGGVWLLGVLAAGLVAWTASRIELSNATWIGGGGVLAAVATGLLSRRARAAVAALFGVSAGVGLLAAGADRGVLEGLAPALALAWGLAEAGAVLALALGRPALAAPAAVAVAAATTGGLAWVLDAGIVPATPWGVAAGGALAVVLTLHARWGEGAIGARHGAGQLWHAAATRFLEGPRGIVVRVVGLFSSDDDFFAQDAT